MEQQVRELISAANSALEMLNAFKSEHPDWPAIQSVHDQLQQAIVETTVLLNSIGK